jgi:hypothetical protein
MLEQKNQQETVIATQFADLSAKDEVIAQLSHKLGNAEKKIEYYLNMENRYQQCMEN